MPDHLEEIWSRCLVFLVVEELVLFHEKPFDSTPVGHVGNKNHKTSAELMEVAAWENPWMIYNEVFATLFHQLSWEIKNKEITFNVKIFYIWSSSSLFHVPLHYLESTLDLHCWTRGQIIHVVPLLFKVSSIIHSTATAAFLKALWTSPQP